MAAKEVVLCEEEQEENNDLTELDNSDTETLSLCDLPLNSKASEWEEYYSSFKEDRRTSFDHQVFQFFSEEFTNTGTYYNSKNNIMFCGKLITCKESEAPIKALDSLTNDIKAKPTKKSWLPMWGYLSKPKTGSLTTKQTCFKEDGYKGARVNDFPIRSRWYLFAFGVGRFPMEMELTDIKTRQRQKRQAKGYPSNDSSQMVKNSSRCRGGGSSSSKNNSSSVSSKAGKRWRLLHFLGRRN